MSRERLIIDGHGTEREVRPLPDTIISRPPQRLGITGFSEYLDTMQGIAEAREADNVWQEAVDIRIDTPYKWYGIRGFCDSHIGHQGVDYDYLREYLAGFLYNDNLSMIGLGDLGDFFIPAKHPSGMLGDVMTPDSQLFALRKFFTEYKDKMLAVTNDPSHTDWVFQYAGIDPYRTMVDELNIPLVNQGGRIGIEFGTGVHYDIIPFHNIAKFRSSFNLTHAHKRVLELHRDGDVVMAGHIHKGAFEKAQRNGHEVALIQNGTMKVSDGWGSKMGFLGRPEPYYPIVLLNTQEKRIQVVDNLSDAEDLLRIRMDR